LHFLSTCASNDNHKHRNHHPRAAIGSFDNTPSTGVRLEQPPDSQNRDTGDTSVSLPLLSSTNESGSSRIDSVSSSEPSSSRTVQPKEVTLPHSMSSIPLESGGSITGHHSGPPKLESSQASAEIESAGTPMIGITRTKIRVLDGPLKPKERGLLSDEETLGGDTTKMPHVAIPMAGAWPSGLDPTALEDEDAGNIGQVDFTMEFPLFSFSTNFPRIDTGEFLNVNLRGTRQKNITSYSTETS
jgi:hypothetical protein